MTKRHLLLSAAVMALMIGGTSPAGAQYYRDYKPNDKPAVEVDMGVLDGNPVPEVEPAPLQPLTPLPRMAEPAPAPAPVAPAPTRVLKPSGPPPAAVAVQEEEPAATPPPMVAKPYRPYLTTPVAKPAPAPQVAVEETPAPVPAPQPVRSYPPAPTPKTIEWEAPAPAPAVAPKPVRSYPEPKVAEELTAEPAPAPAPMPQVAEPVEPPAPLPQPMPKPVVAKKYEPSPSVVDDASYKPDYSGYYKSGAPVPAAVAAVEPKQPPKPQPKPVSSEPPTILREEEIAAAPAPAPASKKDIAEQLTEELAPPPPLEKTAEAAPSKHAADELTEQLPPAKLEPLPEIATERSIEQTPPPAKRMEPIMSEPKKPVKMAAVGEKKIVSQPEPKTEYKPQPAPAPASTSKIVSMPVPPTTPSSVAAAPVAQPERTPAKIISYPDSTVVARPTGQSAPVMAPEPQFIAPAIPVEKPEEQIVSLPEPQRKPEPVPAPAPEPVIAAAPAPAKRPSLEILDTPAPERPAPVKIGGETAESILPPTKEAGKTDIAQLAADVDKAAADMGTAPELSEPPKFAAVPTHSDLTLEFPGNSSDLTASTQRKLDAIVRQMEDLVDGGRLQVRGYAAGEDGSKSSARRIALSRALSVRSYLMDKGVKAKRVDVRAMGSETDRNPLDRVDLIFQR